MKPHIRLLVFSFIITTHLWLLSEAPKVPTVRKREAFIWTLPPGELLQQTSLNMFLKNGWPLTQKLAEKLRDFGVQFIAALKCETTLVDEMQGDVEWLRYVAEAVGLQFYELNFEVPEDAKNLAEKVKEKSLVVPVGGWRWFVWILQEELSPKFWIALLDYDFDKKLRFLRSFPTLTPEELRHFLEQLKTKRSRKRKLPHFDAQLEGKLVDDRPAKFVAFLQWHGIKVVAVDIDAIIKRDEAAAAEYGKIPPSWAAAIRTKGVPMVTRDFKAMAAAMKHANILLQIVTYNDRHLEESIGARKMFVKSVLRANGIKFEKIVVMPARLGYHKFFHLAEVTAFGVRAEVLLIDNHKDDVENARIAGYPALEVVGENGFEFNALT